MFVCVSDKNSMRNFKAAAYMNQQFVAIEHELNIIYSIANAHQTTQIRPSFNTSTAVSAVSS